jgi:sortase A
MPWARLLATLGKAMIVSGLVLIGFAAYELWGTGLHTQQAQSDLEDEYFARLDELRDEAVDDDAPPSTTAVPDEPLDPFLDPEVLAKLQQLPPPEGGDPIGKIEIPELGLDWWIVEGVDLRYLRDGPGHVSETPMPGQPGNAGLAGHRTTYGAPFHNLDRLAIGDEIVVSTFQGKFVYEVMGIPVVDGEVLWRPPEPQPVLGEGELAGGAVVEPPPAVQADSFVPHFIVNPTDGIIFTDYGDNRLTLMACHPKYSARQRIVVSARLVGPAAPPTPRVDPTPADPDDPLPLPAEETPLLEGGDPSRRAPAGFWGLATLLVGIAAAEAGRRWRKFRWLIYAASVAPIVLLLWRFYGHLDALLPAAL